VNWDWQPWVLACLGTASGFYVAGLLRLDSSKRRRMFGTWRVAAFAAGMLTLGAALMSPLDSIADRSFAGHMLQHLLLMVVAAPLLVASRPALAWMCAFPTRGRVAIGRFWSRSGLDGTFGFLMHPLCVWLLSSAVLWFWHLPRPYDAALAHEGLHDFEHLCLFATSLMFWSLVVEPYGRRHLDYGACMLFVAAFSVQMGLLGAVLTFAGRPLYAAYAQLTPAWGLSPLKDQQLAGLLMWIPVSFIHLGTLAVLFLAWLKDAELRADAVSARLV
jgi:cytochrome c oxidase assembly factor CtaG